VSLAPTSCRRLPVAARPRSSAEARRHGQRDALRFPHRSRRDTCETARLRSRPTFMAAPPPRPTTSRAGARRGSRCWRKRPPYPRVQEAGGDRPSTPPRTRRSAAGSRCRAIRERGTLPIRSAGLDLLCSARKVRNPIRQQREVKIPAYFVVELEPYRAAVPATIAQIWRPLSVSGRRHRTHRRRPEPKRIVILEFSDAAAVKRWYQSPEYQKILATRLANSTSRAFIVEGAT
jgi:uncharacterized protein (DUF1330 family)